MRAPRSLLRATSAGEAYFARGPNGGKVPRIRSSSDCACSVTRRGRNADVAPRRNRGDSIELARAFRLHPLIARAHSGCFEPERVLRASLSSPRYRTELHANRARCIRIACTTRPLPSLRPMIETPTADVDSIRNARSPSQRVRRMVIRNRSPISSGP